MVKSADGNHIDVNLLVLLVSHGNLGTNLFLFPPLVCRSVAEAADRQYSYVIVATKVIPELAKTSKILEPLLSPPYTQTFAQPTYVLLQNGLNVEIDLYLSIKEIGDSDPQILSAALWILTNLNHVNVVEHGDYVSLHTSS